MLLELSILDLAIFADTQAEFGPGLNCLTGETGAGKSVFLSALHLLQGARADGDLVRRGADKALVQARVRVPDDALLRERLHEIGAEPEDGELLLSREVTAQGRSRVRIGSVSASLKDLAAVARRIFDLHGQHAEQRLFAEENHAALLISLAGAHKDLEEYRTTHQRWKQLLTQARDVRKRSEENLRNREFLEFQYRELHEAQLKAGEDEELERQLAKQSQSGQLSQWIGQVRQLVSDGSSVEKGLVQASKWVAKLVAADASLAPMQTALDEARAQIQEVAALADGYEVPDEADPAELDRLNARLARIQKLRQRHRLDLSGLLDLHARLETDLRMVDDGEAEAVLLEKQAEATRLEVVALAAKLEALQRKAAQTLDSEVTARLQELGMKGAGFQTRFTALAEPGRDGAHQAVFELCPNPGEGWRDLAEVASGGEASRIMLAIESSLADADPVPLLVFDEVDAGLSGEVAHTVGQALVRLASGRQIIAITHLHQVAAAAQGHLSIAKHTKDGRTFSEVRVLRDEQRVDEIARMLGRPDDPAVRAHALSLLERQSNEN